MKRTFLSIAAVAVVLLAGCSEDKKPSVSGKPEVYTSIQPIAFLAAKIGGNNINVHALIPEGKNPHAYTPSPAEIKKLQNAKLFLRIGLPFEKQVLDKVLKSSNVKIIDVSAGIKRIPATAHHHHDDETKNAKDAQSPEEEELLDPHIWLSPANDAVIAENIKNALIQMDPAHKNNYEVNCASLVRTLLALDAKLKHSLAPMKGKTFFVYHPAFGYFAHQYGLKQEAVELEGKMPTPKHLEAVIKEAKADNVKIIFVQPQFNLKSAELIATAINGKVVSLDPLSGNLIQNFNQIVNILTDALKSTDKSKK
ncbi:MAG: zinc ABC transporter substrate-binding protein [Victivallaceae bacterium]